MRILVGITGGIAAYKSVGLVRLLAETGHDVKVIPTSNALRFIGSATLEAISKNTVDPDLYTDVADVKHVELGQSADLIIVAPATASFLSRMAAGLADDLLSSSILASRAPVLVAPAMHTEMWENEATRANVETLRSRGYSVLEPSTGRLTGADTGKGRMPEVEQIAEAALGLLVEKDLVGLRILVTAGGTREPIDAVRYIANSSSGVMGLALAKAARARGAEVTFIAANMSPSFDAQIDVSTASELRASIHERFETQDAVIMAAAVSDYRVAEVSDVKLKKADLGAKPTIELIENVDILAELGSMRTDSLHPTLIGFAAETLHEDELVVAARQKLASKKVDLIVANDVSNGAIFGSDQTSVSLVAYDGPTAQFSGDKRQAANLVLDALISLRK